MTQPSSQTLRELVVAYGQACIALGEQPSAATRDRVRVQSETLEAELAAKLVELDQWQRTCEANVSAFNIAMDRAETAEAALAAQEASPQPDLAREAFKAGALAAAEVESWVNDDWVDDAFASYLAACRQEQP